jgi:hypothetical protein
MLADPSARAEEVAVAHECVADLLRMLNDLPPMPDCGRPDFRRLLAHRVSILGHFLMNVTGGSAGAEICFLGTAIEELDIGIVAPFLRHPSFPNRHPDPLIRRQVKTYAVATADCLIDAGLKRHEACKLALDCLARAGFSGRGSYYLTVATIVDWHRRRSKDKDYAEVRAHLSSLIVGCSDCPDTVKARLLPRLSGLAEYIVRYQGG